MSGASAKTEQKTPQTQFHIQNLFGLSVTIEEGKELLAKDRGGKSDPYVEIKIEDREAKTQVVKGTLEPKWNETFSFVFDKPPKKLVFSCWDWDRLSKADALGDGEIHLGEAFWRASSTFSSSTSDFSSSLSSSSYSKDVKLASLHEWRNLVSKENKGWIKFKIVPTFVPEVVGRINDDVGFLADDSKYTHLLELTINRAEKLTSKDSLSESDPYCKVQFGLHAHKTKVVANSSAPVWNQFCPLWLTAENKDNLIKFAVWDKDTSLRGEKDQLIGTAFLRPSVLKENTTYEVMLPLELVDPKTDAEIGELLKKLKIDVENKTKLGKEGGLYITVTLRPKATVVSEFYKHLLKAYDTDNDGRLSLSEVTHMCTIIGSKLSKEEIAQVFTAADKDKSGHLTDKEIIELFNSKKFQDDETTTTLFIAMQYGEDAVSRLMNRGLFMDEVQTHAKNLDDPKINNEGTAILVQDRGSGVPVSENIPAYIKGAMRLGYRTQYGKGFLESSQIKATLKHLTIRQGQKMDDPKSVAQIPAFIDLHKLNTDEILLPLSEFKSFNEFFFRKLKPGARKIASPDDPTIAVSPADSRMMVFATVDEARKLWIKGDKFTVPNLLGDYGKNGKAEEFNGGSLVIARLAPQDYHRWHFPVAGTPGKRFPIDGGFDTVNPISIRTNTNVYTENRRVVCPIESKEFGTVLLIAVGATMVGSIRFECDCDKKTLEKDKLPNCQDGVCYTKKNVKKFDPHGFFAFGGSTVLVLFKPGVISFDKDLVSNSNRQLETLVKVGESLGKATGYKK